MKKEVVDEKNEIANNNDTSKFEEVEVYQEVETIEKEIRTDSYFDGGLIELIGWKLLSFLITIISFTINYNIRYLYFIYSCKKNKMGYI